MAEGKKHKTGGQAIRQTIGTGSGKARKSGGEEPNRGEVWSGKERLRNEPNQGKTQRNQSVVDLLHYFSAQPGQIGRGSTVVPRFFSMGTTQLYSHCNDQRSLQQFKNKKPVQL